jgi:hypothetical protein
MPASLERIRRSMDVASTSQDAGLTLTLRVTAYDNGMVSVDGIPMYGSETGQWLRAAEVMAVTLAEFRRQFEERQSERAGDAA